MYRGVDSATPATKAVAEKLVADGNKFINRYIAGTTKRMYKAEAQILSDCGLLINSCYETVAERMSARVGIEKSVAYGKEDGTNALKNAKEIGQPDGTVIYFAADYDAKEKDFDAIEAYLRTANVYIPKYRAGIYGPQRVLAEMYRRGACVAFWQACAWSDGKVFFRNNMHQISAGTAYPGLNPRYSVDYNEAAELDGMWRLPSTIIIPKVGDTVLVKSGAKQYSGAGLNSVVFGRPHILKSLSGDKALIAYNGVLVAYVKLSDLVKV